MAVTVKDKVEWNWIHNIEWSGEKQLDMTFSEDGGPHWLYINIWSEDEQEFESGHGHVTYVLRKPKDVENLAKWLTLVAKRMRTFETD